MKTFGVLGSPEGWTTMISRSYMGQDVLSEASRYTIETTPRKDKPHQGTEVLAKAMEWSNRKKILAKKSRVRDVEKPETVKQ